MQKAGAPHSIFGDAKQRSYHLSAKMSQRYAEVGMQRRPDVEVSN